MKDTAKPMKSIRQAILSTLNTNGELTVDGMLDQITSFDRKTIGANVAQLVTEQLATRRKDDFTGAPAYRITDLGKSRIKSDAAPVKDSLTTEQAKPVVKENLTTEAICYEGDVRELRKLVEAGALENVRLRTELKESDSASRHMSGEAQKLIDQMAVKESELQTVVDECNRLKSRCNDLMETNAELARTVLQSSEQQQVTVDQFLIRVPKRKPLVVKSFEKARQQAMSAAKSAGKVEVYAMVEVGHAVRDAVWNQKQA